jgi:WD40 repeat protein
VWLTGLKLDATKSYNIIIFALSWDATQSTQKVYPAPKPARFDASAVNLGTMVDGVKLEAIPSEIILSGKPGETLTGSIKIKNGLTGLLTYQSSIEGSTQIKLTNEKGAVLYQDEEVVEIEGTCHAGEVQELSHLRLTTNDPQQPSKVIPVKFECLAPLQAQLALKKTSPTGELLFADWSPDGSKIALAGTGGITVWNANTAELLGKYAGNTHAVWSPDGSELAGLVAQGVKIWSAQTGAEVRTISVANPKRVAWSLHGNKIAVVTQNNQVSVFSSTTSALLFQISTTYSDSITDLKWSPDGSKIATSSSDAIIWSGADGSEVRRLAGQYARLAWSPDSTRIVTGAYLNNATQHGVMNIWNAADGNLLDTISSFKFDVANIAWSPDGSQIAATGNDGDDGFKLKVWKTDKTPVSNLSAGSIVAWSPDGKNIISTTYSGLGRIWEIFANTSKAILGYHGGTVSTLEFAQGKLLSGDDSANGSVLNLLDLGSLNLLKSIEVGPPIFSAKLVGNTSIHTLLKIFSNWEIRSWDIASGKQLGAYIPPQTPSVAWSPSGQQVAVAVPNNPIRILDANSGTEALLLEDSTYDFDSYLAWSPDGNTLAAGQINRGILLWNATTGKKLIQYPSGIAGSFVWSLDGKKLAGGGKVFDVATGQTLLSLDKLAYPLAWNPEGRMIVSMQGNEITIYSALTGKKLLNLIDVNPSGYNAIAWSADGNHIAVGKTGELLLYKITLAP